MSAQTSANLEAVNHWESDTDGPKDDVTAFQKFSRFHCLSQISAIEYNSTLVLTASETCLNIASLLYIQVTDIIKCWISLSWSNPWSSYDIHPNVPLPVSKHSWMNLRNRLFYLKTWNQGNMKLRRIGRDRLNFLSPCFSVALISWVLISCPLDFMSPWFRV